MNRSLVCCLLAVTALGLAGCRNSAFKGTALEDSVLDRGSTVSIQEVTAQYEARQYEAAYSLAEPIARDRYRDDRYEAAYLAGLSAQVLGDLKNAEAMLNIAIGSDDRSLAVDAADALGLVYSQLGRYELARRNLLWAAEQLQGERQAKAYYYGGIAQQKLGQWGQARTTLLLARGLTRDTGFQAQINEQIAVTGWTLQLGAFTQRELARKQAESIAEKSRDMRLGLPRLVDGETAGGDTVTFVHVGQFTSYQSALQHRDALGKPGVIIRAMVP